MKKWLLNMKLRTRLILSFAIIAMVPVICASLFSYYVSSRDVMSITTEYTTNNMDIVCREIDRIFEEAGEAADAVTKNMNIQEYIRRDFKDIPERYSCDLKASMELLNMYSSNTDIYGIYVLGENGGQYKSNYCSFQNTDFVSKDWYRNIIGSQDSVWFAPHKGSYVVKTIEKDYITLGKPIVDKASGSNKGIVLVELELDAVMELIDQFKDSGNGFFVVDDRQNIIFQSSFYHEKMQEKFQEINDGFGQGRAGVNCKINGRDYMVISQGFHENMWKIYALINIDRLSEGKNRILVVTLNVLLITVLIMAVFIVWNANSITKPITMLEAAVEEIRKGNLNVSVKAEHSDEIGQLIDNFNSMVETIGELNGRIYEEQKNLRKAEMKALQAQINPHFLYNSLDSITWLLRLNRVREAVTMVSALTVLFKVALSKGRDYIAISDELKHAESYLRIQKIRYNNKFDYKIRADERVKKYRTIKLLLQPLIENAIYHGISGETEEEYIQIEIAERQEEICFNIRDTGQGIPADKLKQLRTEIMDEKEDTKVSYGLKNIYERLKVYYMGRARMDIDSVYGEGTEVSIWIPREMTGDRQEEEG